MTTRICMGCNEVLALTAFHKKGSGTASKCKACARDVEQQEAKTKKGVVNTTYDNQLVGSRKRGHQPPAYTRKDLRDWLFAQPKFHHLFHLWEASGYDSLLKPSVDRLDDYEGYTFSNIQLMTWGENKKKGHADKLEGRNTKCSVAVVQIDEDGNVVAEYVSAVEAGRVTGIHRTSIAKCCGSKQNYVTAGGYSWKFKKDMSWD